MKGGGVGGEVAKAPAGPPPPLEWKFSQVFGERTAGEEVQEGNLILVFVSPGSMLISVSVYPLGFA